MRDGGGVDELAPLHLVLCHLERREHGAPRLCERRRRGFRPGRRATAARAQRAPRGAIPRGEWVGLGRPASLGRGATRWRRATLGRAAQGVRTRRSAAL
eukprot:scaffold5889_cov62-Phaeocystis_antarctica.AAC.7